MIRLTFKGKYDYPEDVERIVRIFRARGFDVSPNDAYSAWRELSASDESFWIRLFVNDADVFDECLHYLVPPPISLLSEGIRMSLPPIPTNSPFFSQEGKKAWFRQPFPKTSNMLSRRIAWMKKRELKTWSPIIASLARCAWLDEKRERMRTLEVGYDPDGCLYWRACERANYKLESPEWRAADEEEGRRIAAVEECDQNAESWRKWGKGWAGTERVQVNEEIAAKVIEANALSHGDVLRISISGTTESAAPPSPSSRESR